MSSTRSDGTRYHPSASCIYRTRCAKARLPSPECSQLACSKDLVSQWFVAADCAVFAGSSRIAAFRHNRLSHSALTAAFSTIIRLCTFNPTCTFNRPAAHLIAPPAGDPPPDQGRDKGSRAGRRDLDSERGPEAEVRSDGFTDDLGCRNSDGGADTVCQQEMPAWRLRRLGEPSPIRSVSHRVKSGLHNTPTHDTRRGSRRKRIPPTGRREGGGGQGGGGAVPAVTRLLAARRPEKAPVQIDKHAFRRYARRKSALLSYRESPPLFYPQRIKAGKPFFEGRAGFVCRLWMTQELACRPTPSRDGV